ncbi:MAG: ATP-dependent DNA helicase RecG [Acidobacteriota bacterium]
MGRYPTFRPVLDLLSPVKFVKGVGPKRAEDLASRDIFSVEDLLLYLPYRYEDRTRLRKVRDLRPGEKASVLVTVLVAGMMVTSKARLRIFDLSARDETGTVRFKWFHSEYLAQRKVFKPGQRVIFYGKFEVDRFGTGNLQAVNPEFEILDDEEGGTDSLQLGRIVPVYEAIKGCSSRILRRTTHAALQELEIVPETLPTRIIERHRLEFRQTAFREAHFPGEGALPESLALFRSPAQQRLIFEELFFLELGLALKRRKARSIPGIPFKIDDSVRQALVRILPFHPTAAQKRVLKEIVDDLCQPVPMSRLLQGDVGSGKTIVALEAAVVAMENGYQVALLVPTEILAEQHYFNTQRIFKNTGYAIRLLKSKMKKAEKAAVLDEIASGQVQLVIGTHALLEKDVTFDRLGLVIIDEQHRFGVMQRLDLMRKGVYPHTLVMTATPIPRTLAMTLYGDLDVSVIDELPPNRSPITTRLVSLEQRSAAYAFIRDQVRQGRQVYVVCPLIEESEKIDLKAAEKTFEHLAQQAFPELKVALLHGRMKPEEKERVMRSFLNNETQILVSTTVIEVGVDVANATVMVIEEADRFGLAQLHQLRGRIGRGSAKSYCLLFTGERVSEEGKQRLQCMVETTDGFKIAERDLEIRGPGEFFGTRQSGLPSLRVANLLRDRDLLELARREAREFVEHPPSEEEMRTVVAHLRSTWKRRYGLVRVG